MDIYAEEGYKVRYVSENKDAVSWGGHDDPSDVLEINKIYTVDHTEVHSYHTKVVLQGFPNKKFNSVHFEEA